MSSTCRDGKTNENELIQKQGKREKELIIGSLSANKAIGSMDS